MKNNLMLMPKRPGAYNLYVSTPLKSLTFFVHTRRNAAAAAELSVEGQQVHPV